MAASYHDRPIHALLQKGCSKTKLCKFYLEGKCKRGRLCTFAHSASEIKEPPDLRCTRLCPTLLRQGKCTNQSCTFAHHMEELRSPPHMSDSLPTPAWPQILPPGLVEKPSLTEISFCSNLADSSTECRRKALLEVQPYSQSLSPKQVVELIDMQRRIDAAVAAIASLQKKHDKTEVEEPTTTEPFAWADCDVDDEDLGLGKGGPMDQKLWDRQKTEDFFQGEAFSRLSTEECFQDVGFSRSSSDTSWIAEDVYGVSAQDQSDSGIQETSANAWSRQTTEESSGSADECPEDLAKHGVIGHSATCDALPFQSGMASQFSNAMAHRIQHFVRKTFVELAEDEEGSSIDEGIKRKRRPASAPAAFR